MSIKDTINEIKQEANTLNQDTEEKRNILAEAMGRSVKEKANNLLHPLKKRTKIKRNWDYVNSLMYADKATDPDMKAKAIGTIAIANVNKYKQPITFEENGHTVEIIQGDDAEKEKHKKDKNKINLGKEILNNPLVRTVKGFALKAVSHAENGVLNLLIMHPPANPLVGR